MIQKKVTDFFALEGNYPDLDGEGAAARLSAAIRCKIGRASCRERV